MNDELLIIIYICLRFQWPLDRWKQEPPATLFYLYDRSNRLFVFAFINSNKILISNMIYSIYTPASIFLLTWLRPIRFLCVAFS